METENRTRRQNACHLEDATRTPEEACMPEVSLALDGLTLDGGSRAQDLCVELFWDTAISGWLEPYKPTLS